MVSFADSPFKFPLLPPLCFLDPLVLAFGIVKLLHPVRRNRDLCWYFPPETMHLKPLCRTICKCELYCLTTRSPHFINQSIGNYFSHVLRLISLRRKNALKYILLYLSKLEFQRMRHTFPVRLQRVFILFGWNLARMCPDDVAKKPCYEIFVFGLLRK